MTPMGFSIPASELVNFVTMTEAIVFGGVLATLPSQAKLANRLLATSMLVMAAIKGDQLFQMLGGLEHYPQFGFILSPFQALMTPLLYLYVGAVTRPDCILRRQHFWHLLPFALMLLYWIYFYFRLDLDGKIALLASGELSTLPHRLLPSLLGDAVQLGYLWAAFRLLQHYGVSLRNWFSQVENHDRRWLKRLIAMWAIVFMLHAIWVVSATLFDMRPASYHVLGALNLVHFAMTNAMILIGLSGGHMAVDQPVAPPSGSKYGASGATDDDRARLFAKVEAAMERDALFLQPELSLAELADQVAATPRELSEAINGVGEQNFFDFVNGARVRHAQGLLAESATQNILQIAYASGFNSKSSFNEAFRRHSQTTPSKYRERAQRQANAKAL